MNNRKPDMRYNDSGLKDMTAYIALRKIQREERQKLIHKLKDIAKQHGYEIVNIIRLKEMEDDKNER